MRITAGNLGRLGLSSLLCLGLVTGSGLSAAVADETPPVSVFEPGTEAAAQEEATATGLDVVVDDATTPTEVTVAHEDGTFTRTVHAEPVRMETSTGWKDISTDLQTVIEDGKEVLKPEMVPVDLTLGTSGSEVMATLDDGQGHSITQSWPFGDLPEPIVDADMATYPNVLPGVDLVQIVHNTGVSQVLRIANAEAARDPRVTEMRIYLDSQNASVSSTGDGGLQAKSDSTGSVELRTASGQWWDSSQPGASVKDPGGHGLTKPFDLSLGKDGDQQTQVFGMDEILDTPNMVYPIFVDPDWSTVRTSYIYVDSGYPTVSYWNGQYSDSTGHVGFLPAAWGDGMNHVTRTYYQFVTSPLAGKVILSARLDTVETWASSCTPTPVSAWITGGVNSGTTWNAQPAMLQKVSTQKVAKGYSGCAQGTVSFDMGSAKSWLSGSPQWTVALRADNESDPLGWKRFTNNPVMRVTYDTKPNTPGIYTISGGLWKGTAWAAGSTYVTRHKKPAYTVTASDPDGTAGGTIKVFMTVRTAAGALKFTTSTPISGSAASGTKFTWSGGGDLPDGKYRLEAQTKDQQGQGSGIMVFNFTVDTTPPPAPVITAVTPALNNAAHSDTAGVVGATAYTLSLTKGPNSYDVNGFIYAIGEGPEEPAYPADAVCDSRKGKFVIVCGKNATITVAAVGDTTTVTAWAFDYSGNVSIKDGVPVAGRQETKVPAAFTFTVGRMGALPTSIVPVTLKGNATEVSIEKNGISPTPNGCAGSVQAEEGQPGIVKALQFDGPGDYAETASSAIDTSKSFTMSAWVCSRAPKTTVVQSLMTQMAGVSSPGAALRLDKDGFLELNQWTGLNGTGQELVKSGETFPDQNQWVLVSAVSDKINRQLRVTFDTGGTTATWTVATASTSHVASDSTQKVLIGADGPTARQFTGQILNPIMVNSVLSGIQLSQIHNEPFASVGVKK